MTILEQSKSEISPKNGTEKKSNLNNNNIIDNNNKKTNSINGGLLSSGNALEVMSDRYITPEYLAPLPPTSSEKTGKSPLQLLAQTCSQIGADTGSNKLLAEKSNLNHQSNENSKSNKRSPALVVSDAKPVSFKPYEKSDSASKGASKPGSVISLSPNGSRHSNSTSPKINGKTPSPLTKETRASSTSALSTSSTVTATSASESATPVIRSGMEILAGHSKENPLTSFRLPAALDSSNPAFRPPFGGLPGFPPTSLAASLASSVCRDPYCRDPSCPTAVYNAQLAAALTGSGAAGLPPGYAELLQAQKLAFGMQGMPAPPSTSSSASSPTAAGGSSASPYICNWMNGREGYCGKRHASADELLQHLRTHANLSTSDSTAALISASLYPSANLLGSAGSSSASSSAMAAVAAGLHRTYPGIGNLSSNRFHPYSKPGGGYGSALPPSLGLGALGMTPTIPPSLASLGAASGYSPSSLYALYGSRFSSGSLP